MSTISVSNIETANGSEPLTLRTGNTSAGDIIIGATGGVVIASNATVNTITANATGTHFVGNVNVGALRANGSLGTLGQVLTSNASATYWGVIDVSGKFTNVNIQKLTDSGSFTPTSGLVSAIVFATGGGGGGGGADGADTASGGGGGGGGAGGTAIGVFSNSQMTGATYACGVGGSGGSTSGGNGTAGGTTTFTPSSGTALTANGADFGNGSGQPAVGARADGGVGGVASGGLFNVDGGDGADGAGDDVGEMGLGGLGGGAFWGSGGSSGAAQGSGQRAGASATTYGSGGGGAGCVDTTTGAAGGNGANGVIMVIEFLQ
jgi:hypothetical protein